jgi:hypothetical protein
MGVPLGTNETASHYALSQPDRGTSKYYHPANPTMVTKPATALPSGRFIGQLPRGPNSTVAAPTGLLSVSLAFGLSVVTMAYAIMPFHIRCTERDTLRRYLGR